MNKILDKLPAVIEYIKKNNNDLNIYDKFDDFPPSIIRLLKFSKCSENEINDLKILIKQIENGYDKKKDLEIFHEKIKKKYNVMI